MFGAASSGYGHCPEGVPVELALLSILAAFGVSFGLLYRGLTLKTAKRRKREFAPFTFSSFVEGTADFFWSGRDSNRKETKCRTSNILFLAYISSIII